MPTLNRFSRALEREHELAAKRVEALTYMCGIALLPDDLLANIFDVVLEFSRRKDVSALVLSQVCRRFRCVAMATSSLWSCIRAATNSGFLSRARNTAYLERSGVSPLDITFDVRSKKNINASLGRFMDDVLPHAARWRQFHLNLFGGKVAARRVSDALKKIGSMHLPNVERLAIFTKFYLKSWFDEDPPLLDWNAPKLRTLELEDFAMDLRNFSSLTDVSVSIYSEMFPFGLFFDSLGCLHSLRALHIGLNCTDSTMMSAGLTLPSVSRLSFAILVMDETSHSQILSSLSCPNVTHLSIDLSVTSASGYMYTTTESVIQTYFAQLFGVAHTTRCQHVTHLRVKVKMPAAHLARFSAFGCAIKEIPLTSLPSLQHLTLEGLLSGPRTLLELQETGTFPGLRTITIQSPRPDKLQDWILKVVRKLTAHGLWRGFEQLVIRKQDERKTVVEHTIIHRDQVQEWLDSIAASLVRKDLRL